MELKVLGCYGSEGPGFRTSCFLVNRTLAIDAGALTSGLSLTDQAKVNAVLISHTHLDHIQDLGFLADNMYGRREKPVRVYGLKRSLEFIKEHFMNNRIWPDFTQILIPNSKEPVIIYEEVKPGEEFQVEGLKAKAIPVNHPILAVGYIISDGKTSMLYSGDTGSTERIWREANRQKNLKLVLIEVSFPNRMEEFADITGHLTPLLAQKELDKLNTNSAQVYAFHMKPSYLAVLKKELERLKPQIKILEQGEIVQF